MSTQTLPDLKIETPRLVLRPLHVNDAEAITALADNWNVVQHLGLLPYPYKLHHAESFIEEIAPRRPVSTFAVCSRADGGALAGIMGFSRPQNRVIGDFGYWLGEPFWGRGLATEAGRAALTYARTRLSAREIRASCRPENSASARVLAKCGFRTCGNGTMKSTSLKREVPVDLMIQTSETWNEVQDTPLTVTITGDGGCADHQSG